MPGIILLYVGSNYGNQFMLQVCKFTYFTFSNLFLNCNMKYEYTYLPHKSSKKFATENSLQSRILIRILGKNPTQSLNAMRAADAKNMAYYDVPNLLHSWMDGTLR